MMMSHVQSMLHLIKYQKQDSQNTDYFIGTSTLSYDNGEALWHASYHEVGAE